MVRWRPNPSGSVPHPQTAGPRPLKILRFSSLGNLVWQVHGLLFIILGSITWRKFSLWFSCSRLLPPRERITSTTRQNGARRRYESLNLWIIACPVYFSSIRCLLIANACCCSYCVWSIRVDWTSFMGSTPSGSGQGSSTRASWL
jgi:hypothetical protein